MIKQSDIIADLHTHTIFSKHGYSTIQENIAAACKMNLKFLAITDHIYNDGTELAIKNEATRCKYLEKEINSNYEENQVYVIGGAEFNIAQELTKREKLMKLRWRPIGLHGFKLKISELTLNDLINEFEKSARMHNAFAHIERELHKIDNYSHGENLDDEIKNFFDTIIELAKLNNIFLELNESSIRNNDDGNEVRINYWIRRALDNNCRIYLASDAHFSSRVGKFPLAIELLNEIDYPKELILNCDAEQIKEELKIVL